MEKGDSYVKQLQDEIKDSSDAEKVEILLEKIRYWYWSAIDWRGVYEAEIVRKKENERGGR